MVWQPIALAMQYFDNICICIQSWLDWVKWLCMWWISMLDRTVIRGGATVPWFSQTLSHLPTCHLLLTCCFFLSRHLLMMIHFPRLLYLLVVMCRLLPMVSTPVCIRPIGHYVFAVAALLEPTSYCDYCDVVHLEWQHRWQRSSLLLSALACGQGWN